MLHVEIVGVIDPYNHHLKDIEISISLLFHWDGPQLETATDFVNMHGGHWQVRIIYLPTLDTSISSVSSPCSPNLPV